jgi:hypothetical protein
LPISQLVSSPSCVISTIAWTFTISNTILVSWVGSSHIWLPMQIGCLLQCMCECSYKVCFLILPCIVIPHLASHRFHVWRSEVGNVERSI